MKTNIFKHFSQENEKKECEAILYPCCVWEQNYRDYMPTFTTGMYKFEIQKSWEIYLY